MSSPVLSFLACTAPPSDAPTSARHPPRSPNHPSTPAEGPCRGAPCPPVALWLGSAHESNLGAGQTSALSPSDGRGQASSPLCCGSNPARLSYGDAEHALLLQSGAELASAERPPLHTSAVKPQLDTSVLNANSTQVRSATQVRSFPSPDKSALNPNPTQAHSSLSTAQSALGIPSDWT